MFGDKLLEIRQLMGFSSALSFYQSLESRATLEFNYAYYKKIENGEKLPSVKIVHHLIGLLPKAYGEQLILSFCETQFPQHTQVFSGNKKGGTKTVSSKKKSVKAGTVEEHTAIGQQELTERQIATIAKTEHHFYLFSLLTLSRRALDEEELEEYFTSIELDKIVKDLSSVKLLYRQGRQIFSSYPEYRYPKAHTSGLKEAYKKLDAYDLSKLDFFKLEKQTKAHFFRRISPRYLSLILNSIELLYQTVRMADDFDSAQNDVVCSLSIRVDSGELPG